MKKIVNLVWTTVVGGAGLLLAIWPDIGSLLNPRVYGVGLSIIAAINHANAWWQKRAPSSSTSSPPPPPAIAKASLAVIALFLGLGSFPAHAQLACTVAKSTDPLTATITWTAPTSNVDGSPLTLPVTYSVFKGLTPGAINIAVVQGVKALTFTAGSLTRGTTVYFAVVAVTANGQSTPSNYGCKVFPSVAGNPKPAPPLLNSVL